MSGYHELSLYSSVNEVGENPHFPIFIKLIDAKKVWKTSTGRVLS